MVRIRNRDGTSQAVPAAAAVEVLDGDGRLAMVVFTDHRNLIRAMIPGDPVFTAYCHAYGLGAARIQRHDELEVQHSLGSEGR